MSGARYALPLLLIAGCAAPQRATPTPAAPGVAPTEEPTRLRLTRIDAAGETLPVRAVVHARDGHRVDPEPLAALDARDPDDLRLAPGRYRVWVDARPGPFGFDVVLAPGRETAWVRIVSAPRGHTVLLESWTEVSEGVSLVERQILGFGWGPRPDPTLLGEAPPPPSPKAVLAQTLQRAQAALDAERPPSP